MVASAPLHGSYYTSQRNTDKDPVEQSYAKFRRQATFGEWLSLGELMSNGVDDNRNPGHLGKMELGMEIEPTIFRTPRYMTFEMLYQSKQGIEINTKKEMTSDDITIFSGQLQALVGTITQYEMINQELPDKQKVNYRKRMSDFVKVIVDENDPISIEDTLQQLYNENKQEYNRFIKGFTDYAGYLLNVGARKKVEGKTLKSVVKKYVDPLVKEYLAKAIGSDPKYAQALQAGLTEIRSGTAPRALSS